MLTFIALYERIAKETLTNEKKLDALPEYDPINSFEQKRYIYTNI